jgi:hypothetical protein
MNSEEYASANSNVNINSIYNYNSFKVSNKIHNSEDRAFGVNSRSEKNNVFFRMKKPDNIKNVFESQITFS